MIDLVVVIFIAGTPPVVVEILTRRKILNGEVSRKVVHVVSSLTAVVIAHLYDLDMILILGYIVAPIMMMARFSRVFKSVNSADRKSYGEIAFTVGVFASAYLARDLRDFAFAMLCLAFVDTAALLIGKRYGKHKIFNTGKTLEGTLAATVTALVIAVALYPEVGPSSVLLVGVAVALFEAVGVYGTDSVTLPVGAVLAVSYIG